MAYHQKVSKTHHYPAAEHRRLHSKQDDGSTTFCRRAEGTRYTTTGDPLYYHHRKLFIANFELSWSSFSRKHGLATFVHKRRNWILCSQSYPSSDTEWLCVEVDGYKIINIYKPPPTQLQTSDLPMFSHPSLYAVNFNLPHSDWGYNNNRILEL